MTVACVDRIAERYGLDLVVLFGSRVKGRARPDSDLDIGVWFEHPDIHREGHRYEHEREIRRAIAEQIPKDGPEVDIVFLNRTDSLLLRMVAETGKPIYVQHGASWPLFRVYANRRYWADEPYRRKTEAFLRRKYGGRSSASGRQVETRLPE